MAGALCEYLYGDLLTEDALFILVNGTAMNSADQRLAKWVPGWDSYEITDARMIEVSETCRPCLSGDRDSVLILKHLRRS